MCVSQGVAEEVRSIFPALAERVLTIHNGVDTDDLRPRRAGRPRGRVARLVGARRRAAARGSVGSEWARKGLEPAIRALAGARAGPSPWPARETGRPSRRSQSSSGWPSAIRWLGVRSDIQVVYQAADAFVFPTSYETFSLVTFEAAATGLPILATPVSGVRELIEDGRNGFLITREPAMIAERLNRLAEDPQLRRRLGAAARESALGYSWERMVAAHSELYLRLTGRSRPVQLASR